MMSAGAAGDGLVRGVFEGCISGTDTTIRQRPYHKNCKCALHKRRSNCTHSPRNQVVSLPIRRSWSEGCLALMSPTPSPRGIIRTQTHLALCKQDDQDHDHDRDHEDQGHHISSFSKV